MNRPKTKVESSLVTQRHYTRKYPSSAAGKKKTGNVYGGQKINGQNLDCFNPPHEFLKLYKIIR
ncbi:hypothetical protein E2C01_096777 [Portunus trituberculatus]|uniref:Uncharacterized protein n=1 Tax=Portunus trituberculatus TaxID=210409 RepID=A0A5B7K7Q9_PORTR|nr:hypothetical protein [Portunus trituberculatus]